MRSGQPLVMAGRGVVPVCAGQSTTTRGSRKAWSTSTTRLAEGPHDDLAQEGVQVLVAGLPRDVVEHARGSDWFAAYDDAGKVLPTVDAAVELAETRLRSDGGA